LVKSKKKGTTAVLKSRAGKGGVYSARKLFPRPFCKWGEIHKQTEEGKEQKPFSSESGRGGKTKTEECVRQKKLERLSDIE